MATIIKRDGKKLELVVNSGGLFFNVTKPLEDDESMDIRTSTTICGIRGTCGWVEAHGDTTYVGLFDGKVECTVTADGKEAEYIISGFTQISNNLGKDCLLTSAGYRRMGVLNEENYYINLEDGTDIDKFNKDVSEKLGDGMVSSINMFAVLQGTGSVYVTLMTIIVAGILVLSLIVVILSFLGPLCW